MRARVAAIALAAFAAAALIASLRGAAADDPADAAFSRDVAPILRQWCFKCHAGEHAEEGLDLSKVIDAPAGADAGGAWRAVRRKLRRGEMPPKKAPQPPAPELAKIVAWIESRGDGAQPPADPGRVTVRRLSRFEYRCTIRDLLGVDFDAESRLPPDEVGLGFDNIGDVMSMPPALLEKYLAAAEDVANRAIVAEDPERPPTRHFDAARMSLGGGVSVQKGWAAFYSNGAAGVDAALPREGEYVLRARACGDQAGPDPARMAFRCDGAVDRVLDVKSGRKAPEVYETRLRLPAGRRRVSVAFVNDYYEPTNPDPARRDRNLYVEWMEIVGPLDARPVPDAQRRIYGDDAKRPRDRAFALEIVKKLADRAFRRPATADETRRLADVVMLGQRELGSFDRGVQSALTAVLVSPNFLYRVETDPSPRDAAAAHDLTDYEIATRLSYFLWSSLPDEELAALAAKGALRDRGTLAAQTKRMLRDARSSALVTNFAAQWLELRRLAAAAPDPGRFPQFDEALRGAMRTETEMFVEALIRENRPLREFLDADFTFVNERLAKHYGIVGVKGEQFQRVRVDGARRGGLLTQASLLTLTSNPTRTSPVKRGKFLLEEILAEPPAPPPPGVGALDESDAAAKSAPLRERLARHRSDPKCADCHARMDALGFALENFDPVGAWRDRDGTQPVDAVGTLPDGRAIAGAAQLRAVLLSDDAFARCLAEKLLVYAVGRAPTGADRDAIERLTRATGGLDATFADVVAAIVETDGFRRRRGEGR